MAPYGFRLPILLSAAPPGRTRLIQFQSQKGKHAGKENPAFGAGFLWNVGFLFSRNPSATQMRPLNAHPLWLLPLSMHYARYEIFTIRNRLLAGRESMQIADAVPNNNRAAFNRVSYHIANYFNVLDFSFAFQFGVNSFCHARILSSGAHTDVRSFSYAN